MIFQLDNTTEFPDPRYGNADGFYAVGGEVTPERLAKAYPMGIFPYFAFSLEPNASKLALIHLARHMQAQGGGIIDCQLETPHLKSMGARYISYDDYLNFTQSSEKILF